jgi:hypothetical protein
VVLERYDDAHHGFVRITVSKAKLIGEFFAVADNDLPAAEAPVVADSFALDLTTHRIADSGQVSRR